jgi:hypothetical protein
MLRPKKNLLDKVLRRKAPFYASIEDIFDIVKFNPPTDLPHQSLYAETEAYEYFAIFTRVGVGDENRNKIRNVHIRFRFEKIATQLPEIQIVRILPNDKSRIAGTRGGREHISGGHNIETGAKAEVKISGEAFSPITGSVGGMAGASITKKGLKDEYSTYELPYYIQIRSSSGIGRRAVWDFNQGKVAEPKGQYDLVVIFKIGKPLNGIKQGQGSYQIFWNIKINEREVLDHNAVDPVPRPLNFLPGTLT